LKAKSLIERVMNGEDPEKAVLAEGAWDGVLKPGDKVFYVGVHGLFFLVTVNEIMKMDEPGARFGDKLPALSWLTIKAEHDRGASGVWKVIIDNTAYDVDEIIKAEESPSKGPRGPRGPSMEYCPADPKWLRKWSQAQKSGRVKRGF